MWFVWFFSTAARNTIFYLLDIRRFGHLYTVEHSNRLAQWISESKIAKRTINWQPQIDMFVLQHWNNESENSKMKYCASHILIARKPCQSNGKHFKHKFKILNEFNADFGNFLTILRFFPFIDFNEILVKFKFADQINDHKSNRNTKGKIMNENSVYTALF